MESTLSNNIGAINLGLKIPFTQDPNDATKWTDDEKALLSKFNTSGLDLADMLTKYFGFTKYHSDIGHVNVLVNNKWYMVTLDTLKTTILPDLKTNVTDAFTKILTKEGVIKPDGIISASQRKDAIGALSSMIDWLNKLSAISSDASANFNVIMAAASNTKPNVESTIYDGLTNAQLDKLNEVSILGKKNIQDFKSALPKCISNYTDILNELKKQSSLESILSPVVTTPVVTTPSQGIAIGEPDPSSNKTTNTNKNIPTAETKDYKLYYVLGGGVLVTGIILFVILKHK